jgi:hypothetical protein
LSCLPSLHLLKVRSLRQTRSGSSRRTLRVFREEAIRTWGAATAA